MVLKNLFYGHFRDGDSSSSKGLDIGITGTNGTNSSWRVFLRVFNGSTQTGYTGSSELIMTGAPVHIRVKRGSDNLLKAFVNGVQDISQSITQDLQPSSASAMVFGDTTTSSNDEYKGLIHEIKVYCGGVLSNSDATKVWTTKPISQYMKFDGRIRKVDSNQTTNKAICQSNSYEITTYKLGSVYASTPDSHALSSASFKSIVQSAVDEAGSGFSVRNLDTFSHQQDVYTLGGNIYEIGSVVEFIGIY